MADPSSPAPRPRRRVVLLALVAVLLVALAAEAAYALTRPEPTTSPERPIVLAPVAASAAARTAAGSTAEIVSYGFEDLEAQVATATSRMTPEFAEGFRQRVLAGEESLVAQRATQEAEVLAAGVVTATPSRAEVLVFLDRRVAKAGEGTTVRPYRVLVTLVRSGGVWLVSDIETR